MQIRERLGRASGRVRVFPWGGRHIQFSYGGHQRLTTLTHPNQTASWQIVSLQTIGLPTGTSGNSLTPAGPEGTFTDERSKECIPHRT